MGRAKLFGHVQNYGRRMMDDDPEMGPAQTPKCLDGRLALPENVRRNFTDSILNNDLDSVCWSPKQETWDYAQEPCSLCGKNVVGNSGTIPVHNSNKDLKRSKEVLAHRHRCVGC